MNVTSQIQPNRGFTDTFTYRDDEFGLFKRSIEHIGLYLTVCILWLYWMM